MNMKLTGGLLGIVSLLTTAMANAATVQIDPANLTVANGATFSLTVQGVGFPLTVGGGFRLTWDTADLTLTTDDLTVESRVTANGFDFPAVNSATPGQIDIIAAIGFLPPIAGDFNIVTLDFTANQPGITVTNLGLNPIQPTWADENFVDLVSQPNYVGSTITINANAVPIPPAVWLFGSGLIGLIGVGRRRKQ